ncbi:MAG: GyrI-like domain-containing protein [Methanobacterium sp.]|jgi:effector-binding domain-containing protein|nr:GyrI-like domain-containing protein [Methanobacterium sp.]
MEVVAKKIGKRQVAYIKYKGSYEEVPVLMGEVVGFIMAKGLQVMGPPFGVYFNSPHEVPVEELRYEIAIPFTGEAEEEGRVKIKTIPEQLVLSTVYKGPYSECGAVIKALAQHASQNDYEIIGSPMETYISDPNETPEKDLLTEMCFPVMKK